MPKQPKPPLIHVASMVFDTPLAIIPAKLDIILSSLGPRLVPDSAALNELIRSGVLRYGPHDISSYYDDDDDDMEAYEPPPLYTVTDSGIALIPIHGTLMKKGGFMSALSGCASYEGIGKAVSAAMTDPMVKGVLFDIDSPGGTTHGLFECCDLISSYRGKGRLMYAIANDLAASAAYALASCADRIFLTRTGGVGSLGVFCLHVDQSEADKQRGVKYTYIHAGEHKVDGNPHSPLSKSAKSTIQSEVDRQYNLFVSTVAKNRGISPDDVIGTKADVMFGRAAIPTLADDIATYDGVIATLTSKLSKSSVTIPVSNSRGNMADTTDVMLDVNADKTSTGNGTPPPVFGSPAVEIDVVGVDGKTYKAYIPARRAITAASPALPIPNIPEQTPETPALAPAPAPAPSPSPVPSPAPTAPSAETYSKKEIDSLISTISDKKVKDIMPEPTTAAATTSATPDFTLEMATEIADLCAMVGQDQLSAAFIRAKTPVADVRKALIDARATVSALSGVSSTFASPISPDGVEAVEKAAVALVSASGGKLTKSRAYEQVLSAHPELYDQASEERAMAARGTPGQRKAYMAALRTKLPSMGLSAGQ